MTPTKQSLAVRRTLTVNAPQAHTFTVFTEGHGTWWPLQTHHIGKQPAQTAVIEPRAGGRWFERAIDGSECNWGRVLVWDPPQRLVLGWEISQAWQYDPSVCSEVEVRFIAEGPKTTRVEFEHRHFEVYGDQAETYRSMVNSENGWTQVLAKFEEAAGARP